MATETSTETVNDSTEETSGQEVENNKDTSSTTSEPEGNGQQQEPTTQQDTRLPDDHPLVKAYASSQEQLKQLKGSHQSKVAELETKVQELTTKAESAESVQLKYDRLESFLTKVGGPLSKALDSRSFTTALFESDEDIDELVSKWHRDNPSATSSALNSGPGSTQASKDMNALLRKAAG